MYEIINKYFEKVPRGTVDKIFEYYNLLKEWNKTINLIASNELNNVETFVERHILDSLEISNYLEFGEKISDIGSGGGLPGMILSIIAYDIDLYEIDQRKAIFLKEIIRKLNLSARVYNCDINKISHQLNFNITARAFAELDKIFKIIYLKLPQEYKIILPKGKNIELEINKALLNWQMTFKLHESTINNNSKIIIIEKLEKIVK